MKARVLARGDILEVGDILRQESWAGKRTYRVHRVTRTLAFIFYNESAEGSFKRDSIGDKGRIRPRGSDTFSQVSWTAYREIQEKTDDSVDTQ